METRQVSASGASPASLLTDGFQRSWRWTVGFIATPNRLVQFGRYLAVSVIALVVDLAAFLVLMALANVGAVLAGGLGVLAGLVFHYTLSARFVFADQETGKSQRRLIGEYLLTGGAGVVITTAVIFAIVNVAGLAALIGKGAAVVVSFLAVYAMRAGYVFNGRTRAGNATFKAPGIYSSAAVTSERRPRSPSKR
jgi:putative flippase GtrA